MGKDVIVGLCLVGERGVGGGAGGGVCGDKIDGDVNIWSR